MILNDNPKKLLIIQFKNNADLPRLWGVLTELTTKVTLQDLTLQRNVQPA